MSYNPLRLSRKWIASFVLVAWISSFLNYALALDVYPGGQTIGIQLNSNGVMVVGTYTLHGGDQENGMGSTNGQSLKPGDFILAIDDQPVHSIQVMRQLITKYGQDKKEMRLTIVRNQERISIPITPKWDEEVKQFRLGVYLRDQTSGIGTLSFWIPEKKMYGALGHPITEGDSKKPIPVKEGNVYSANVTGIRKSEVGNPGEKQAEWSKATPPFGTIEQNTQLGIFGKLLTDVPNGEQVKPMPVARMSELKPGPVQILTVIQGNQVERFNAEVLQVQQSSQPSTKSMVIRITDQRLLDASGGIVQGMSGSPIIQDGKLIGAVTHVLVKQPNIGFACSMEWMLAEAGIRLDKNDKPTFLKISKTKSGDSAKSPLFDILNGIDLSNGNNVQYLGKVGEGGYT